MFKVYSVQAQCYYSGIALVAANSAKEANEHIVKFKESDPRSSRVHLGYGDVEEDDAIAGLHSEFEGIIYDGIC